MRVSWKAIASELVCLFFKSRLTGLVARYFLGISDSQNVCKLCPLTGTSNLFKCRQDLKHCSIRKTCNGLQALGIQYLNFLVLMVCTCSSNDERISEQCLSKSTSQEKTPQHEHLVSCRSQVCHES